MPIAEPQLGEEERQAFVTGVAQFNAGYFFECHDTLEELWSGIRGPSRDFFQGLIQVSVGFYHLRNDNRGGALSLLQRALGRLEPYPEEYGGLDLGRLRQELALWCDRIEAGAGFPATLEELPQFQGTP